MGEIGSGSLEEARPSVLLQLIDPDRTQTGLGLRARTKAISMHPLVVLSDGLFWKLHTEPGWTWQGKVSESRRVRGSVSELLDHKLLGYSESGGLDREHVVEDANMNST